jgi:hypothetical protein
MNKERCTLESSTSKEKLLELLIIGLIRHLNNI